ncbi:hypothetical protein PSPO01_16319 [Paraphaeosphaeria sporulosa]
MLTASKCRPPHSVAEADGLAIDSLPEGIGAHDTVLCSRYDGDTSDAHRQMCYVDVLRPAPHTIARDCIRRMHCGQNKHLTVMQCPAPPMLPLLVLYKRVRFHKRASLDEVIISTSNAPNGLPLTWWNYHE